jgi:hypothetical protein
MRFSIPSRIVAPELLFGVFHTLIWLLLVLQVSAGVVVPLARTLSHPAVVEATLN